MKSVKPVTPNNFIIDLVANSNQEVKKYSDILSRFRQKKPKTTLNDITVDDSGVLFEQQLLQQNKQPLVMLPIVRTASERVISNDNFDNLQSLTTPSLSLSSQLSTSSLSSQQPPPPPGSLIRLNTRLNGKHKGNWKMSKTDPFTKV